MKILIILFGFIFITASSITAQSITALPEKAPAAAEMRLWAGSGMQGYLRHVTISGNLLLVEERTSKKPRLKKKSATISEEDKMILYRAFVANKFDLTEIAANKITVYDAPSRSIFISADRASYDISNGANSPLAGANLKSFENIVAAFEKIVAAYQGQMKTVK